MKTMRLSIVLFLLLSACSTPKPISPTAEVQNTITPTTIEPSPTPTQITCNRVVVHQIIPSPEPTGLPTIAPDSPIQQIVITTVSDKANGDTSNWEALIKKPGGDGISLREALIVANLTKGPKLITFDSQLTGQTLMLTAETHQPLPRLSSGDLTIDGDINHDGKPDITLDGSQGGIGPMDIAGPTSFGLVIWSSGNQINGLKFQNIAGPAVTFGPLKPDDIKSVKDNRITNNEIDARRSGQAILMGTEGQTKDTNLNDFTWQNTMISGNKIQAGDNFAIMVIAGGGASNIQFIGTTIRDNILKPGGIGLLIADTNSNWHTDHTTPPVFSKDNMLKDTLVQNNQLDDVKYYAIGVLGANGGNHDNLISNMIITDNTITNSPIGIHVISGDVGDKYRQPTQNNTIEKLILDGNNVVSPDTGIFVGAGGPLWYGTEFAYIVSNQINGVEIRSNTITNYHTTGIEIWGARANNSQDPIEKNMISGLDVSGNILKTTYQKAISGILIMGGLTLDERGAQVSGKATQNGIEKIAVMDNQVQGGAASIMLLGGRGILATGNFLKSLFVAGNQLDQEIIIENDNSKSENNSVESLSHCPW